MANVILKIVILTIALLLKDVSSNKCTSQQACGKCISKSSQCAWCSQENFGDNGSPRCDYVTKLLERDCDPEYIHEPVNHLKIIQNKKFGHYEDSEDIHIRPQEIKITLTPNSVRKFWVDFRQIQDNPLDLYFLMDLSTTDKRMMKKMVQLGNELANELPKITSNFRIGFGTFVPKRSYFCYGCGPPLAFRNVMMLSSDTNRFTQMIEEVPDSDNLETYRGLDFIIKAIMCKDEIGWRKNSRKVLLYASDDYYHYADPKQLTKIITSKDEICQLDSNGYFNKGTECDCISASQIDHHIRKSKVRIIFAVTLETRKLYLKLSRNLSDSSIGTLDGDLSKIIDMVREQYDNIRSTVELRDNLQSRNIKVTYYSKCRGSKLEKTNYCKGLRKGNDVTFDIEMELASCPAERKRNRTYSIYPVGLRALLAVNLEIQCDCDCEKPGINEINSPKCSENGTFECGACTCKNNKYGDKCECVAMDADIPLDPYMGCKENANDTILCSGRGECICGVCHCFPRENPDERVFGRVCQCDNFLCDTHNGVMCSGPDHGRCDCGKCACHSGWKGSNCSCPESDEYCFNEE